MKYGINGGKEEKIKWRKTRERNKKGYMCFLTIPILFSRDRRRSVRFRKTEETSTPPLFP